MFSKIRDVFTSGEKILFHRILRNVILVETSLRNLGEMISHGDDTGDVLDSHLEAITRMEKEGDALTMELTRSIRKGAIAPGVAEHFLLLIHRVEDILDDAYFLAGEISRVSTHGSFHSFFCIKTYREAERLHALCLQGAVKLRELIEDIGKDFDASMRKADELEEIEEKGDDVEKEILDSMYEKVEHVEWWIFEHVLGLIRRLDDILDLLEDCGNETAMILSILRG